MGNKGLVVCNRSFLATVIKASADIITGYNFDLVNSAESASEYLSANIIKVIIIDNTLPDAEGREFAASLKGKVPGIILLSGFLYDSEVEPGIKLIKKPWFDNKHNDLLASALLELTKTD